MEVGWPHSEDALTDPQSTEVMMTQTEPQHLIDQLAADAMKPTLPEDWAMLVGGQDQAVAAAIANLLIALDVTLDGHTVETPKRAAKMWRDLLAGETTDPSEHLTKTFEAPRNPGLVIQSGITLQSVCAHHLLPFVGRATVAYRPSPGQDIVGLSKLARVVLGYAARLQVQERIGTQVVDAIMDRLNPSGAMVLITATHDCMRLRGVRDPSSETTTEARGGVLLPEEMQLIHQTHLRS